MYDASKYNISLQLSEPYFVIPISIIDIRYGSSCLSVSKVNGESIILLIVSTQPPAANSTSFEAFSSV
jgi:hypothetical protein